VWAERRPFKRSTSWYSYIITGFRREVAENCALLGDHYSLLRNNPDGRSSPGAHVPTRFQLAECFLQNVRSVARNMCVSYPRCFPSGGQDDVFVTSFWCAQSDLVFGHDPPYHCRWSLSALKQHRRTDKCWLRMIQSSFCSLRWLVNEIQAEIVRSQFFNDIGLQG
jgi:hypothetical protein